MLCDALGFQGFVAVGPVKTSRSRPAFRLELSVSSCSWKHILAAESAEESAIWQHALSPLRRPTFGVGSPDNIGASPSFERCCAPDFAVETSTEGTEGRPEAPLRPSGWLWWLDEKPKEAGTTRWKRCWSVVVHTAGSALTTPCSSWLLGFDSPKDDGPPTMPPLPLSSSAMVSHLVDNIDTTTSALAPLAPAMCPDGQQEGLRLVWAHAMQATLPRQASQEGDSAPLAQHTATASCVLLAPDDSSSWGAWIAAVRDAPRVCAVAEGERCVRLGCGLLSVSSEQGGDEQLHADLSERRRGLQILLGFLDIVPLRQVAWDELSQRPQNNQRSAAENLGNAERYSRKSSIMRMFVDAHTDVIFSGFLFKQGMSSSAWRRRFIILKEGSIIYQKTQDGGGVKGSRGGVVQLAGVPWSIEAAPVQSRQHCFAIFLPGQTLMLAANSEEQKHNWLAALESLRASSASVALRCGIKSMFASADPQSQAEPAAAVAAPMRALLRTCMYEVDALCEYSVLKSAVLQALDSLDPSGGQETLLGDLGELEIEAADVHIKELLAEGMFGKVYKAEMHGLDVAVKKIKLSVDAEVLSELRSEVDMLSSLRHPNVIQILGASTRNPANLFIVTEYVNKGSLYNVIHDPLLTDEQTVSMVNQVVLGCNFLHERTPQVLHRDLKPLNLLVDANFTIRVADFGISVRDSAKFQRPTQGTFAYMAPEVVFGVAPASTASDVFAFGVVLFEWFYIRDHPGIDFTTHDDVCFELIHEAVHSGREPSVPFWWHPQLRQLILQCLANDPDRRPSFVAVLARVRALCLLCKADPLCFRRFAVEVLRQNGAAALETWIYGAPDSDAVPDVLNVLRGYIEHAGTKRLQLMAVEVYLTCAAQRPTHEAGAMQTTAVELLEHFLDNDTVASMCKPGLPWVALPAKDLEAAFLRSLRHRADRSANQPTPISPSTSTSKKPLIRTLTGVPLPSRVPRELLFLGQLLRSTNLDVARWAEERLASLPAEPIACSEDVRRELRRLLMSREVDVDEITGKDVMRLLSRRFESTLLHECKAMCESEMVAVVGMLTFGPPSVSLALLWQRSSC
jgi:hypothetical protein